MNVDVNVDVQHFTSRAWIHSLEAIVVSVVFSSVATLISVCHLLSHLRQYTMPSIQSYIVRIIFICPVYAISAALSMGLGAGRGEYVNFVTSTYEAFAVFSLLSLVLEYCGGEADCVYGIEGEPPLRLPFPLCLAKPRQRNAKLIRSCKRGVLQFVAVKPLMCIVDICAFANGFYDAVWFQVIESIIYNGSYGISLYCLIVFFLATKQLIRKFNPGCKIVLVKTLIVATFYQSLLVKIAPTPEEQFLWRNLLLSVEMLFFATSFVFAFPSSEFLLGIPNRSVMENLRDSYFTFTDVVEAFRLNFGEGAQAYRDYALQRSDAEAPATARIRTYFQTGPDDSVALEAAERYRGRSKRLAFNSLLRGTRPISAGLRRSANGAKQDSSGSDISIDEEEQVVVFGHRHLQQHQHQHQQQQQQQQQHQEEQQPQVADGETTSPLFPPSPIRRNNAAPTVPLLAPPPDDEWGEFSEATNNNTRESIE